MYLIQRKLKGTLQVSHGAGLLERLRFAFTANMNGKNYHVIMIFPPFFTSAVCHLPFAIFNAKRTVFAFVNNVSIYRKFFNLSTTFTGLCLGLMLFYFVFYAK